MNFAIVNLGCKVNRVESDSFASGLLARGGLETGPDAADVVVVNTCTVTGEAEKKTRKAVRQVLRANPASDVVVTGCAAAIDADAFTSMDPDRVHIAGKLQVDDVLDRLVGPIGHGAVPLAVGEGFRTRVGVKVQDGCNNACTYCIVHVARGRASSRPAQAIVSECVALAREGVREIVLTGINLGSWREQGENGCERLDALLERLLAETADIHEVGQPACRFRISSIEPRDVSDDLIRLMARSQGRICRHLHLPLQSGNSKVLREMHRPYSAEYFKDLVEKLYTAMPMLSLSTDIICGFPGETDQEFGDTVELAPAGIEARVRSLQVHGRDVEAAYAGQRTAVNLAGIKKALVRRGDTVVSPGSVRASRMLDVHLRCLGSSRRTILNNSQLHLYHGASVLLAKMMSLPSSQTVTCVTEPSAFVSSSVHSGAFAASGGCVGCVRTSSAESASMVLRSEMCSVLLSAPLPLALSFGTEKSRLLTLSSSTGAFSGAGECSGSFCAVSLSAGIAVSACVRRLSSAVLPLPDGFRCGVNHSVAPRISARHAAMTEIGSRGEMRPSGRFFAVSLVRGALRTGVGCAGRAAGAGRRRTCCMMRAVSSAGGSAAVPRTAACSVRKSS